LSVYGHLDQLEMLQQDAASQSQASSMHQIPENHRSFLEGLEAHERPLGVKDVNAPQLRDVDRDEGTALCKNKVRQLLGQEG